MLSRRRFLRSAAFGGIAVALPALESLPRKVASAQEVPDVRRLVIFHFPDGCYMPDWTPTGLGRDWQAGALLDVLADHHGEVGVVTGLSNHVAGGDAHEAPMCGWLTGTARTEAGAAGPSVDVLAAEALGGGEPVRIAASEHFGLNFAHNYLCWSAAGAYRPNVREPRRLFDSLFGGFEAPGGGPSTAALRGQSVLDHVRDEIDRVRARCGVTDRRILDDHFDAIRAIETSLATVAECSLPAGMQAEAAAFAEGELGHQPVNPDEVPARVDLLARMAMLALRCDLTRVVVLSLGYTRNEMQYPWLGLPAVQDDHELSHHLQGELMRQGQSLDERWEEIHAAWNEATRWKLSVFASVLDEMSVPDAEGRSLLDSTVVVAGSELGPSGTHSTELLPVLVAGRVGRLADASLRGQHLVVPCDAGAMTDIDHLLAMGAPCGGDRATRTPISNLWRTVLETLGRPSEGFGDSTGTLDGLWL